VGGTLTADTSSLGGSGAISYQWKRGSDNVGADSTYVVQSADTGSTITVTVTRSGYSGSVTSNPTLNISKIPGLTVNAPVLSGVTNNSITINPITALNGQQVEYAISASSTAPSSGWQSGTTFTGLNAVTTYYIFARTKENNIYKTGEASGSLTVTTLQTSLGNRFEYYWVNQHGSLITTSGGATTVLVGGTLIITAQGAGYDVKQWYLNGINTGQNGNTYNFSSATIGKHLVSMVVEKDGRLYNANITITVAVPISRVVTIDMYDFYGDGWNGNGALRINVNGIDIANNVKVSGGNFYTYAFNVTQGDIVRLYWVAGSDQEENSFIVYYANTPPSPAFTTNNQGPTSWSGNNALIYRLRNSMNSISSGTLLGSFTVQ
jgi:hypothetical protein